MTTDIAADPTPIAGAEGPVRYAKADDGIVWLTLDAPGKSANTYTQEFKVALRSSVERLAQEIDSIRGVVITSAKRSFFAGGDLTELIDAKREDTLRLRGDYNETKAILRHLETIGVPVVAAINGAALGGGFEIALACHYRIAVDVDHLRVGLPEVTFGLLPGGGGVVRTVRLLGAAAALENVLLQGQSYTAVKAHELGLVDEVVADDRALAAAAQAYILSNPQAQAPWDREGYTPPGRSPRSAGFAHAISPLVSSLRNASRGAPARAPISIAAAALEGAALTFEAASEIETRYFVDLVVGQESKNRIRGGFLDLQAVKSGAARPQGYPTFTAAKVGVVGAGMMGAGIAYVAASRGISVVLQDITQEAADRGKGYAEKVLAKSVKRGSITEAGAQAVLDRISTTTATDDFIDCDVVVEAVFENPGLKKELFARIDDHPRRTFLASNTSTIPISDLAEGTARPADFIGMHFFSPVDRMAPVEIIVGDRTSDETIAQAMDFAKQIGKLPIVVNDGRGFFTSRVIGKRLDEALAMLGEGWSAASIEQAASQAGYPVPLLQLLDETTITLPRAVRREGRAAAEAEGREWTIHPAESVMDRLIDEFGRGGRVSGNGFYEYDESGKRTGLWPGLAEHFARDLGPAPIKDLVERLLFSEALEALHCLTDGVLRSHADANVGSQLAIGFPAWTGGVLQYINGYPGGLTGFALRADELADRYGERFRPPTILLDRAAQSEPF